MENKTFTTPEAQQEAREQARAQRNKKIFIFSSIAIIGNFLIHCGADAVIGLDVGQADGIVGFVYGVGVQKVYCSGNHEDY